MVEFAVVAPVLFLLIFGILELGRLVMVQQLMTNAVREGCRKAVLGSTTTDSTVETVVRHYLRAGGMPETVASNPAKVSVSVSPSGSLVGLDIGTSITVQARLTSFSEVTWLPMSYLGSMTDVAVQASATMHRE